MTNFWILESIKFVVLLSLAYGLGRAVQDAGVKVNYTRKVIHFVIFFLPVYLGSHLPYDADFATILTSGTLFLLTIALMVKPVRSRSSLFNTAFASIDRPEDRPHTLLWVSTQVMATFPVLCIMLYLLDQYEQNQSGSDSVAINMRPEHCLVTENTPEAMRAALVFFLAGYLHA